MVVPPDQVKAVDSFDVVVLGSAVCGALAQAARALVDRSGDALAARPVWLFSSGPIGDPPKPEEDPVDVAEILQATKAREHRVFAGKLVRKQLNFPDRAIAASAARPRGRFPGLGGGQGLGGGDRGRPAARLLTSLRPATRCRRP